MKTYKKLGFAALFAGSVCAIPVKTNYILSEDYTVTIHGTSNLHSWDEKVGAVSGDGSIRLNEDGSYDVNAITLKMEVHSIKSDMGGIMNNNTYKALKADANPQIILSLGAPLRALQIKAGEKTVAVKANLNIAGVTRPIELQIKIAAQEHGKLSFEGSEDILMTDYGVKPPTALLGTLKTGNLITIHFKTSFAAKPGE